MFPCNRHFLRDNVASTYNHVCCSLRLCPSMSSQVDCRVNFSNILAGFYVNKLLRRNRICHFHSYQYSWTVGQYSPIAALVLATRVACEQSASRHSLFECCDWLVIRGVSGEKSVNSWCGYRCFCFCFWFFFLHSSSYAWLAFRACLRLTKKRWKIAPVL